MACSHEGELNSPLSINGISVGKFLTSFDVKQQTSTQCSRPLERDYFFRVVFRCERKLNSRFKFIDKRRKDAFQDTTIVLPSASVLRDILFIRYIMSST